MCQLVQIRHNHCNVIEYQAPLLCPQAPRSGPPCRKAEILHIEDDEPTCPGPAFCGDAVRYIYRSPGLPQQSRNAASDGQAGVFVLKVEDYSSRDQNRSVDAENSPGESPQDEQDLFLEELLGFFGIFVRVMPPGATYPRRFS